MMPDVMPVDVYESGNGDLMLCQEWPDIDGDAYSRIKIPLDQAESVARRIIALAERLKQK